MCAAAKACLYRRYKKMKMSLFKASRMARFLTDTVGAVAIVFVMALPVIIAAAGMSVDLAQAYNVKNRLANALDKAALAAGSTSGTAAEIEDRVRKFMAANYQDPKIGTVTNINVTLVDNLVTVSASSRVQTTFMSALGQEYLDVDAESVVRREMAGVEVVLVLDVTGSMAGSNIAALKTAALDFIDIMFRRISDVDYLRIGIVPFSQTVNVGPYGLGKDHNNNNYGRAFVFRPSTDDYISPASNIQYGTTGFNWAGCILERSSPNDTSDTVSPDWAMYRYPRICSRYNSNGTCRTYSNNNPNRGCPVSPVIPLTNDRTRLENSINGLIATGNTYINVGMVWGWRLISPSEPFTEATDYNDPDWTKTVIVMTDGDNVPVSEYSAYGRNASITANQLNNKVTTVCNNMKTQGVTVYTITFQSGINGTTRTIFRQCATDESKYFDAPSDEDLRIAFGQIANQLSELHIVK